MITLNPKFTTIFPCHNIYIYSIYNNEGRFIESYLKVANKDLEAMVSENVTLKEASAEANQKLAEVKTELEALQLSIKVLTKIIFSLLLLEFEVSRYFLWYRVSYFL